MIYELWLINFKFESITVNIFMEGWNAQEESIEKTESAESWDSP